jgi:hypothetical protein
MEMMLAGHTLGTVKAKVRRRIRNTKEAFALSPHWHSAALALKLNKSPTRTCLTLILHVPDLEFTT